VTIQDDAKKLKSDLDRDNRRKVRVALFGQPGSGKSSLINKLTGQPLAQVGVHTDTTVEAMPYEWEGLILVDLPGYDTTRFPRDTYFSKFDIPSFDLFLCVFAGKLVDADTTFFRELRSAAKVCLFVRNKIDDLWQEGKSLEELTGAIQEDVRSQLQDRDARVLFSSCRTNAGIDTISLAIRQNLDAAKRERWARSAKAYSLEFLSAKRDACATHVTIAAGASAANALTPIPGVDAAIDLGILHGLFAQLRRSYGLTEVNLSLVEHLPNLGPLAKDVLAFATKEGVMLLLKQFAKSEVTKNVSKYVPIVGQTVAALLGFAIVQSAGNHYHDRCYRLAEAILTEELRR